MSFREKSAWITLVTVLVAFSVYFGAILTGQVHGWRTLFLLVFCVIGLVALQVVLSVIATVTTPKDERAVKDAHIDAYLGDRVVRSTDVAFKEPVGAEENWGDASLSVKCDRIRITVRSFYKNAAGIAEVQLK